uniref:Predicted protein n=1 Tax=Hordeum vulgare subsp. vulgare TaxID=112509 RepID=F2DP34_HORVV|nr:predicted protein [Hordeum vulgare subsp. vulgare]
MWTEFSMQSQSLLFFFLLPRRIRKLCFFCICPSLSRSFLYLSVMAFLQKVWCQSISLPFQKLAGTAWVR